MPAANQLLIQKILIENLWVIVLLIIWSIYWKGRALWKASHRESLGWFIAILIVNTLGILEILYIYIFSERKPKS